jgi:hypothetical protein
MCLNQRSEDQAATTCMSDISASAGETGLLDKASALSIDRLVIELLMLIFWGISLNPCHGMFGVPVRTC